MEKRLPIVGVMGSRDKEQPELTVPLGQLIARLGAHLLTGGGRGVMLKVTQAFCSVPKASRAGVSIGILPTITRDSGTFELMEGYPNPYVEVPVITPLPVNREVKLTGQLNRNYVNILSSNVVVALPGGPGTANEIELALRFGKPLALFDPQEHYEGFEPSARRVKDIGAVEAFLSEAIARL